MPERRDRVDYHCARARVGRDRTHHVRRGEAYEYPVILKGGRQPKQSP